MLSMRIGLSRLAAPQVRLMALRQQHASRRLFHTSLRRFNQQASKETPKPTGSRRQGLKDLTKKYGWSAFGVYMALSAIDLPITFVAVHSLGQERIAELEVKVRQFFGLSTDPKDLKTLPKPKQKNEHSIMEDDQETKEEEEHETNWNLLLTEFGVAYLIHKSFIFLRVPATAALTPPIVKALQKRGWNIGSTSFKTAQGTPNMGVRATNNKKWWWFF